MLAGPADSTANGINNDGVVVGTSQLDNRQHAFRWTPARPNATTGAMSDLGVLRGDDWSFATGINRHGAIVGYSQSGVFAGEIETHPFISITGRRLVPFARMPALFDVFEFSSQRILPGEFIPNAINHEGAVAGWSFDGLGNILWPVLWTPRSSNGTSGEFINLGGGDIRNAQANALNDHAQVVGANRIYFGPMRSSGRARCYPGCVSRSTSSQATRET